MNSCKSNYSLFINYSKLVVDWVGGFNCPNNSCSPLIADCKYLLNQLPRVKLKHYYKKTNRCADVLVRHGAGLMEEFIVYNFPLVTIINCIIFTITYLRFELLSVSLCESTTSLFITSNVYFVVRLASIFHSGHYIDMLCTSCVWCVGNELLLLLLLLGQF